MRKGREEIRRNLEKILAESDPNVKGLRLAGLITTLFREDGFDPVIVGGSAIEFYTDGAYVSGDIDICFAGNRPNPAQAAAVVGDLLGGTGSVRTWKIGDMFVDLLGEVEAFAREDLFGSLETPEGPIRLQPIEDLLVERVFSARGAGRPHPESESCARKLLGAILENELPVDWEVAEEIAASPAYQCLDHLREMKREIEEELKRS